MKKFKFLVAFGLKKRVFRKAFVISNIIVGLILMIVINIPSLISIFGDQEEITELSIYLVDQTEVHSHELADDLMTQLNLLFNGDSFFNITTGSTINLDVFWAAKNRDVLIVFSGTIDSPQVDIYSKHQQFNAYIISNIGLLINQYQIPNYEPPVFTTHQAPDFQDPDQQAFISSMTSLLVLPMFFLITLATQFIGVDIIEEKSTKAIETIISSVPAKIHFLSKITAAMLFIIIQSALLFLFGVLGSWIGRMFASDTGLPIDQASLISLISDMLPNFGVILMIALLFMLVGTIFYLVIASLFASMATTQEDYQQFQAPLMILLVAGFYIGIFAPMAGGYQFIRFMTFIPFFTPMVAPIAYASGAINLLDALVALIVLIIFTLGALYLVAPVYRIAILSYDQTKFFKRIKNYFKKAFNNNNKK
jgi:ABC-2 type transport system permease protein